MYLSKSDLENLDRIERLNIVNSVTGIKPANLVGTISDSGHTNLAIFSSVIHLGSHPALLGLMVRPGTEVRRDSYENILKSGIYTINHVHHSFTERAHYTSAKFGKEESEFDQCGFTEEYLEGFGAPFVKESVVKLGLKLTDQLPIKQNGTVMLIGEIHHAFLPDNGIGENGHFDLGAMGSVGISGLNTYYALHKHADYPYARVSELPWKKS